MKTIHSLVTKPVNQNVAVIRISGPEAFTIINSIAPQLKLEHNKVEFTKLYNNSNFIDEVVILPFKGPNSFTGEDVVEIQGHGNMFLVREILDMLQERGSEQAKEGEFMKQAYENGKIDLTQSEAINSLILAEDQDMTIAAQRNLNSEQSSLVKEAMAELSQILGNIQVSIDYPENQDLEEYSPEFISSQLDKFITKFSSIKETSERMMKVSQGVKVAFVGRPNAGKSTLLNRILDQERAIVSDEEGTTRDVIESQVVIGGNKVTLQDTAGIRNTDNSIEAKGIEFTTQYSQNADILIRLFDPEHSIDEQKNEFESFGITNNIIIDVITKGGEQEGMISIEAKDKSVNHLIEEIETIIIEQLKPEEIEDPLLVTANQVVVFNNIIEELSIAKSHLDNGMTVDVVGLNVENSIKLLGKMLGEEIDQDYLTDLFSGFCVGK